MVNIIIAKINISLHNAMAKKGEDLKSTIDFWNWYFVFNFDGIPSLSHHIFLCFDRKWRIEYWKNPWIGLLKAFIAKDLLCKDLEFYKTP